MFPSVLAVFLSREWKHLTNENIVVRHKSRQSWFRPSGTIKKFRARLNIGLPRSKCVTIELIQQFYCWFNLFLSLYIHCFLAHCEQVQRVPGTECERKDHFASNETEPFHNSHNFLHHQESHGRALRLHTQWKSEDYFIVSPITQ